MPETFITQLSGEQFAARISDLFPRGWASDDARLSGNVHALFLSFAQQLSFVQTEIQYALRAQRLQTETFPELDFASVDYLGDLLPRPHGQTDADFALAITNALFSRVATKQALSNALLRLTGVLPRMMEPWNVTDTGAWGVGGPSYWNVDTIRNPARWGGDQRYQGFIETTPPSIDALGPNNPILTWNTAYWNVPGYFFGIISSVGEDTLNDTLNRIRAYGTEVWVKLISQSALEAVTGIVAPSTVLNLRAPNIGPTSVSLSWDVPGTGTPPYVYTVFYRLVGTVPYVTGLVTSFGVATITGLTTGASYEFTVSVRNAAGAATSDPITAHTGKTAPSPVQNLTATLVQATAITLLWSAPAVGSVPITYTVLYRVFGTSIFQTLLVGADVFGVTLINLLPSTTYDIEVQASNL